MTFRPLSLPIVLPGRFRAAVFDMDGVLLDSEPLWLVAYRELMERHGETFTDNDRVATLGTSLTDSAALLAPRLGLSTAVVAGEIAEMMQTHYRGARLHAGARSLIEALSDRMAIAIATNTNGGFAREALRAAGLGVPGVVVSGEDLGRPKPYPDVYLAACRELGVAPGDAIAFEDSPSGVRSAVDAGLTVVGVPEPGVDLAGTGTHAVIASLEEITISEP